MFDRHGGVPKWALVGAKEAFKPDVLANWLRKAGVDCLIVFDEVHDMSLKR